MNFTPLSDSELAAQRGNLKEGEADFEIVASEETKAKSTGQDMIKLKLKVWDSEGKEGTVFDYITANAQWKIKSLVESIGHSEFYDMGNIEASTLIGGSGKCSLFLQKGNGQYGDSIKVKNYFMNGQKQGEAKDDDLDIQF